MSSTKVTMYYDPISPFAYIAFVVLSRYTELWNIKSIDMQPVFLPGVMKEAKNSPPLMIPNKGKYMNKEFKLASGFFDVDFSIPKGFPVAVKSVNAIRFLRQLKDDVPDNKVQSAAALRFWECVFGSNKRVADIADVQKYPEILQGIPGLSKDQINKVAQASQSDQNKQRVIQEATALANEGLAFGMPWLVVEKPNGEKQNFWGSDRFELMAYWLGKPWYGPTGKKEKSKL